MDFSRYCHSTKFFIAGYVVLGQNTWFCELKKEGWLRQGGRENRVDILINLEKTQLVMPQ